MRFIRCAAFAIVAMITGAGVCLSQAPNPPALQPAQAVPAQPASEQAYRLPPDKLAKAKALNRIQLTLEIVGTLWGLAVLWLLLATKAASRFEAYLKKVSRFGWIQGLIFFAVFLIVTTVASLPLDAIGHAASLHYGISVQQWPGWFAEQGKWLGVSLIGALILLLFNWVVRVSPRRYWLWAWLISLPLIVASVVLEPLVIEPIFNKYEPLMKTHAPLVAKLETVVARTGTNIPPERMFLMKASEKSNGINAYVTGLGASKRLVMWDTTTDRMPDDEILFIFGHESGHYVRNHIVKGLAITMVSAFFVFWACARFAEWLVRRFGTRWGVESVAGHAGFLTLIFALSIVSFFITPAANTVSRHFEHEADVYGQEAIHGLVPDPQKTAVSAFNHLGEAWLEDPDPNPFVEFWDYNHPSVQTRAKFASEYDPWANGGHGKFFEK
jgi:STE24 endopeptidase